MENLGAREKLVNAFFETIKKKPFRKITVTELIRTAGVNRTSFYKYFSNIHDMYTKMSQEVTSRVATGLDEIEDLSVNNPQGLFDIFRRINKCEENYHDIMFPLFNEHGSIEFMSIYREKLREKINRKICPEIKKKANYELVLRFAVDCFLLYEIVAAFEFLLDEGDEGALKLASGMREFVPLKLSGSICENVSRANQKLSPDPSLIDYKLFGAFYKIICAKRTYTVTVSEITRRAGIFRTEFYTRYKNMYDFLRTFALAGKCAYTNFVVELCFSNRDTLESFLLSDKEPKHFEFVKNLFHVYIIQFIDLSAAESKREFKKRLEKLKGADFIRQREGDLDLYLAAIVTASAYYWITGNEKDFKKRMECIFIYRDMFLKNEN